MLLTKFAATNECSRSFAMLLTKFAATGSLFGNAAHEVRSNEMNVAASLSYCSRELCERQELSAVGLRSRELCER